MAPKDFVSGGQRFLLRSKYDSSYATFTPTLAYFLCTWFFFGPQCSTKDKNQLVHPCPTTSFRLWFLCPDSKFTDTRTNISKQIFQTLSLCFYVNCGFLAPPFVFERQIHGHTYQFPKIYSSVDLLSACQPANNGWILTMASMWRQRILRRQCRTRSL